MRIGTFGTPAGTACRASIRRTALAGSAALLVAFGTCGAAPAFAQATRSVTVDIRAQELGRALTAFADQAGLRLLLPSGLVSGRTSPALAGTMTRGEALSRLLAGTGLAYAFTSADTVTITDPVSSAHDGIDAAGALVLDTIDVTGRMDRDAASGSGFQGTPDWVYETPGAVSVVTRQAMEARPPRNTADVVRDTSGVWVENDRRNSGVTANIRGLASNGRVVMAVDDARQNFRAVAGAQGLTDTAFVDSAFLRTVEVEKTRAAGVGGVGALGGMVNFRTIDPDDVLQPGRNFGFMLDGTTGTNAYRYSGSAAAAWRLTPDLSLLVGYGDKRIDDYRPGQSGLDDLRALGTSAYLGQYANYEISKMTAQDQSTAIAKVVWRPDDASELKFSANGYWSSFEWSTAAEVDEYYSEKEIDSRSYALDYAYRPQNPLVDFSAKLYLNQVKNDGHYPYRSASNYCPCDTGTELDTWGGFARNTSGFSLGVVPVTAHYGIEFLRDSTSGSSSEATGKDDDQRWFNQENPDADRFLGSVFSEFSIRPTGWLDIRPALRYDHFSLEGSGERLYFDGPGGIYAPYFGEFSVDRSESRLSPSLTVAVEPREGLQIYGKYVEGFRPPLIQEAMFSGLHIGATSNIIGVWRFFPNTKILPEESRTWEVGLNGSYDDVLRPGDSLRFKASAFSSEIDNYVTIAYVTLPNQVPSFFTYGGAFVNLLDRSTFKGVELEASYDTGRFYVGASYTHLESELNTDRFNQYIWGGAVPGYEVFEDGPVFSIAVPPRHKATLDLGVRLFDERLTLGGRVHYASESRHGGSEIQGRQAVIPSHTLFDLYGSYKINEATTASFSITNLTDLAHGDALATGLVLAPGRTATVSLHLKF